MFCQRLLQDARPRQVAAIQRATYRIEHQQLEALEHLGRHRFISQARDKFGHAAGLGVVMQITVSRVAHGVFTLKKLLEITVYGGILNVLS